MEPDENDGGFYLFRVLQVFQLDLKCCHRLFCERLWRQDRKCSEDLQTPALVQLFFLDFHFKECALTRWRIGVFVRVECLLVDFNGTVVAKQPPPVHGGCVLVAGLDVQLHVLFLQEAQYGGVRPAVIDDD